MTTFGPTVGAWKAWPPIAGIEQADVPTPWTAHGDPALAPGRIPAGSAPNRPKPGDQFAHDGVDQGVTEPATGTIEASSR